jgi:hypothetical protein
VSFNRNCRHEKAPRHAGPSSVTYLATPEPGPVGVKVDPLGEELGPSVLPEGFIAFGVLAAGLVVVEPVALPVVVPVEEPVAAPLMDPAGGAAPAPLVPLLLLCASASVLESASAPANAIVTSFMVVIPLLMSKDKALEASCVPCR